MHFSQGITASIPWKGLFNPAMTGAFSCYWNYMRHPKISKTSKFQGKSIYWDLLKLWKRSRLAGAEPPPSCCLVAGCTELCPSYLSTRGAACCSGNTGWWQRKIWFLLCQMPGSDKPGKILSIHLLVRIWGTWRHHAWTMKKVLFSPQRFQYSSM